VVSAVIARGLARIEMASAALDGLPVAPATETKAAMLFRDFVPIFVADYGRHWKPSTLAGNAFCFRQFVTIFGEMELRAIRRSDVLVWRDSWIARKGSFNRSIPVLSVMMGYAEQLGFRPAGSNPCRGTPRYKMCKMERFLSAAEYRRLASALAEVEQERPQAVSAIRLLLYTGARSPEIEGLRWEWVQPPRLMLPNSKTGPKIILLNAPARAVLEAIAPEDRTGPVFAGEGGGGEMPFRVTRHWPSIRNLAALPDVRLRDLRHSFASIAIANGISLMQIGKLLGHALPETTARYAHLADDVVADAAQRVSGSLARCLEAGA
jgi:integrase